MMNEVLKQPAFSFPFQSILGFYFRWPASHPILSALAGLTMMWLLATGCGGDGGSRLPAPLPDGGASPPPAVCGNRLLETNEACDDGPNNGLYGFCARGCQALGPRCGDGAIQWDHEQCDAGPDNGQPGHCAADCRGLTPYCGNGVVDRPAERCDDGGDNGTYGHCNRECTGLERHCGDGLVEPDHEQCDDGPANGAYDRCATHCRGPGPHCGDGTIDPPHERCDDGPANGLPQRCALDCQGSAPFCGDGLINPELGEECDDGEENGSYGQCQERCARATFPPPPAPTAADPAWLATPPACQPGDWLGRYMTYRLRLRGNGTAAFPGFLSVGTLPGESLPASERDPLAHCANDWWVTNSGCRGIELPDAQGHYSWGDTTIWLGTYIAVLATEHAVFGRLGLPLEQTAQDLHHALLAFNRLDETAESHFGRPGVRDGFFQRDDVPWGFERRGDGSYRFPRADGANLGYECITSTADCNPLSTADGDFISQDQVIGMLEGLALVRRLIPPGLVVQGVELHREAGAIAHRMVSHLRDHGWRVSDPLGEHPPDAWGGNAIGFSALLAEAANRICGQDFGVDDYRDEASRTAGEAIFASLEVGWDLTLNYNRTHALRLVAITNRWDAEEMARRAAGDAKELFALEHALLQDVPLGAEISHWRIEALLSAAPCHGPCHRTPGCEEAPGWMGENRWMSPHDRIGSRYRPVAEYNGLDFLLLHNLYFLYRQGRYGFALLASPEPPPACQGVTTLHKLLQGESDGPPSYDPGHPCAAAELGERFCGRTWAAWLDAAYRGEATLHTGPWLWDCRGTRPCELRPEPPTGTAGIDLLFGTPGSDELEGLAGDDCIYGLGGNDLLKGGAGLDELHGGAGDDELYGDRPGVEDGGGGDVLWGDEGADRLHGGSGEDELYGGEGDDRLEGGTGIDYLLGGPGQDELHGEGGDDRISGGPGDDRLFGEAGDDHLYGEEGADQLWGGGGADGLDGGEGDDLLFGEADDDSLVAGPGHDLLCGGSGDDTLWGGWDGDRCNGGDNLLGKADDMVNGCEPMAASDEECEG